MPTTTSRSAQPKVNYQKLFNSLPNSYIAFYPDDPLFTIAAESDEHARVAMAMHKDAVGKPVFEVFPDTSEKYLETGVSDLIESFRKVIKTGKPDTMETLHYDLPRPDGAMETRYWRVTHYPVFGTSGKLTLIYQATEDITQEVTAGNKLSRVQKQLEEALEAGKIGFYTWNVPQDVVVGDRSMAEMFGADPVKVARGMSIHTFTSAVHAQDRARVKRLIEEALASKDFYTSEYRTVAPDGAVRWLDARGSIKRDVNGKPTEFKGVLVDITERKIVENNLSFLAKASAALSQSLDYKKTLQTIAKLMVPDIADWCTVEILGEDGQLQPVAVAHKDPSKVKWARELRKQQGAPDLDEPGGVADVLRTGKAQFYPHITDELLVASAKDKEQLKLLRELALSSIIMVPLKIHNATVGAITLIMTANKRDYNQADLEMAEELASRASLAMTNAALYADAQKELAARQRLEEELRQANEELEHRVEVRTAELEDSNTSLMRSNQELQDFAYVASHDLQEPLRKIQAFGNLLETEYADRLGDGKDYLNRMRSAAARMSALIEDILQFSRVTTKGREFTSVNLRTVAREVLSDLEIRIADTEATVEIGELPIIHADAMQMRQLFQNLISNSLKFSREGVKPHMKITSTTDMKLGDKIKYCRLEFSDNGLGFDEKYLDRIFSVFQRLHNRDQYEGTGIGLAVCRKIVERHGGTITARSSPGKGATFIIMLPMRHKKGESLV
jgi:PAS domain S-box-containing protein